MENMDHIGYKKNQEFYDGFKKQNSFRDEKPPKIKDKKPLTFSFCIGGGGGAFCN
jgi:hypothetical protein